MPNQMTGRILSIGDIEAIPSKVGKEPFRKRTLVLNSSRSVYGETYENYPSFEFSGKHLDDPISFKVGDIVDVCFVIQGKQSQVDNQPVRYFNTIAGYKIELHQRQQAHTQTTLTPQNSLTLDDEPMPF